MEQSSPTSEIRKRSARWWHDIPAIERYGIRVTLFGGAIALVAVPFGFLLEQVLWDGPLTRFDLAGAKWLHRIVAQHPLIVDAMNVISFTGKPIFLTFALGIPGAWLLKRRKRKLVVFLAVTSIGGGIVDTIVKVAVGRPRPEFDEPVAAAFGHSFPSGHSM